MSEATESISLDSGLTLEMGEHSCIQDQQIKNPSGARTHLAIGNYCSIAADLTILGYDPHHEWITTYPFLDDRLRAKWPGTGGIPYPQEARFGSSKSRGGITIGNDVWIGYDVKLLPGVTIGNGAVIGACSLVDKSIDPYTIVAGIPARPVRKRFTDEEITFLEKTAWWNWPPEMINQHMSVLCSSNISDLKQIQGWDGDFAMNRSNQPSAVRPATNGKQDKTTMPVIFPPLFNARARTGGKPGVSGPSTVSSHSAPKPPPTSVTSNGSAPQPGPTLAGRTSTDSTMGLIPAITLPQTASANPSGDAGAALQAFYQNAADYFADVVPPELPDAHLRNSRVVENREQILRLMPKGGVCAEVGTQTGGFAKLILSILQPAKLHIFDIDYTLFDHNHFQPLIQRGAVQLHKGDSSTLLTALPDRHFDFIYVDGDHSYEGVVRDLEQSVRKIKDGGWIVCNDYTIYSPLEKTKYGVYRAVNEFCLRYGFEIAYLGLHCWGYHDVALRKIGAGNHANGSAKHNGAQAKPANGNGTAAKFGSHKTAPAHAHPASNPELASILTKPASLDISSAAESQGQAELRQLAKFVADHCQPQTYYDDAEQYMKKQWQELIWPIIQEADFSSVLDLAAGHGRNSEMLKQHAGKIYAVDINRENIEFCRRRFADDSRFVFLQNDGCSLSGLDARSISLVFCFDSMVHFDSDVVRAYLHEFQRVMRPGALGFCHHSNHTKNPGGDVRNNTGWRNFMSQELFAHYCAKEGFKVLKSRLLDWTGPQSDCVTLFRKP